MKHPISSLEGALLDAAVAKAEGREFWITKFPEPQCYSMTVSEAMAAARGLRLGGPDLWCPSSDWTFGGPIIERERIAVYPPETKRPGVNWEWLAECHGPIGSEGEYYSAGEGETHLIAAMRAYVASKFGEEVDLP